jgi:hypothetical protein
MKLKTALLFGTLAIPLIVTAQANRIVAANENPRHLRLTAQEFEASEKTAVRKSPTLDGLLKAYVDTNCVILSVSFTAKGTSKGKPGYTIWCYQGGYSETIHGDDLEGLLFRAKYFDGNGKEMEGERSYSRYHFTQLPREKWMRVAQFDIAQPPGAISFDVTIIKPTEHAMVVLPRSDFRRPNPVKH